jgi:hypothetical protein
MDSVMMSVIRMMMVSIYNQIMNMLQELLSEREKMFSMLRNHIRDTQHASRDNMVAIIKNFDQYVLWKYIDSKEVNSKLLEELKFYED